MKFREIANIKTFFFDNHSLKQMIFKNTFWLTLGTGLSKLFNFVLLIYVARILGATGYGKFSFALAFVSLFTVVADLGISTLLVREFSKEKEKEREFYSIISLKIILGLIMLLMIFAGLFFVTQDPLIRRIILILGLFSFTNSFVDLTYAFFYSRQKMEYQAGAAILGSLLIALFSFFVLFNFPSAENLSYAYLSGNLIALIFIVIFFHFKVFSLKISFDKTVWKKFLLISWPLAFSSLFGLLYTYIDSVMLGYWGQITQTGWYNAAYRIAWMGYIFTGLAVTSFYPILSKAFQESKEKLQKIWDFQMELMTGLAVPLMIGGVVLAPRIIDFLYGSEFAPSALALQILIIMAGILLLYAAFYQVLIVANHQNKLFWATLAGAIINIILNLILIPKYSLYGAAFASLLTQLGLLCLILIFTLRLTSIRFPDLKYLGAFAAIVLSGAIMFFVISQPQIYYLNIFLSIIIGVIVYSLALFVLKFSLNYLKYAYRKF